MTQRRDGKRWLFLVLLFTVVFLDDCVSSFQQPSPSTSREISQIASTRLLSPTLPVIMLPSESGSALQLTKSSSTENPSASAYYLLWSPGFTKKLVLATCSLVLWHSFGSPIRKEFFSTTINSAMIGLLRPLATIFPNVVLPLLSSACCLIQILLNFLVGGCAGFNSFFGPVRPYFLSLLGYLTFVSNPKVSVSFLRFSIALLPELLHFWNRYARFQWRRGATTISSSKSAAAAEESPVIKATIQLNVPSMGCVACINKIDNSIRQAAPKNIEDSTSWLEPSRTKGGRCTVKLSVGSKEELDALTQLIINAIEGAGFGGCKLDSVEVTE
jgi:hypothetical protein